MFTLKNLDHLQPKLEVHGAPLMHLMKSSEKNSDVKLSSVSFSYVLTPLIQNKNYEQYVLWNQSSRRDNKWHM